MSGPSALSQAEGSRPSTAKSDPSGAAEYTLPSAASGAAPTSEPVVAEPRLRLTEQGAACGVHGQEPSVHRGQVEPSPDTTGAEAVLTEVSTRRGWADVPVSAATNAPSAGQQVHLVALHGGL